MFQFITGRSGRLKTNIHLRWAGGEHPGEVQVPKGTVFQLTQPNEYCILEDGTLACGVQVFNEEYGFLVVPVDSLEILF